MQVADQERVPAGGALAVDREAFARTVTAKLSSHPQITIERKEVSTVPLTGGFVFWRRDLSHPLNWQRV